MAFEPLDERFQRFNVGRREISVEFTLGLRGRGLGADASAALDALAQPSLIHKTITMALRGGT